MPTIADDDDVELACDGPPTNASDAGAPDPAVTSPPAILDPDAAIQETRGPEDPAAEATPVSDIPTVADVEDLDWAAVQDSFVRHVARTRLRETVEHLESLLDQPGGPGLLFDAERENTDDRAIHVKHLEPDTRVWIVGDLHGDLLALEAALALVHRDAAETGRTPRLIFLGDFVDDGGYGLEVLLRVFGLILETPASICVIAGNHDEALQYDGARFTSTVSPSDFTDFLNAHLAHEWITRAAKLAVRLFAVAPRALFLPDGLLVTHGGFPLTDLHADLRATGNWNDPRCLSDFTWTRAHPRARKKMPNRATRGSQFGYEDFAAFCSLSAELGRPVTRMVRGHDHVDERYEIYPAYAAHPVLSTVALSRRLPREAFGPFERVPTVARWIPGKLPQVHRLHVPPTLVREAYGEDHGEDHGDHHGDHGTSDPTAATRSTSGT